MKRYLSRLLALVLVVAIGLVGCSNNPSGLTGNYSQDTLAVVNTLRTAIELPNDAPDKAAVQAEARQKINDFFARYRRDSSLKTLRSFTTMQTALNGLAAHYSSYPNRPIPEKLKQRLKLEFNQVESAIRQGA
ncbi:photosystem II protein Psb27 [Microseira wollei]|uniref:Photosystem II lipoprotein Psb27 n=1 Tax=Microseira wollei NIES-4236 TaxID=2530354 RepID=A0AAV3XPF9_9CYAN|nr:photosystem II protein Psb27 [Microseira wollei]GET44238.1 photosystem II 11 kD protein [Microseira wollei NIES-4236]